MTTVDRSTANMTPDERRALLARLLQEKARAAREARTTAPLSYGQTALWFTHQMDPSSPAYNVAFAASVHSEVDVAAVGRAFQTLVDRHPSLRTTFHAPEGKPQQVIAGGADLDFVQIDAAGWDDATLQARVDEGYKMPFDLEHGPLLRVFLFTRGPADHVLLVALHHIVFDGWSMGILLDEFQALYRAACQNTTVTLPPLQHGYTDFTTWQSELLNSPAGQKLRDYWHGKLAGTLPLIDLPLDRPRPAVQTFHGATHEIQLSHALVQQLRALAKAEHTTLYAVLLSAFYVLLHRYSGQDDLIVGTPMVGRSRAEFQRTIGYFISPVALRADLAGAPSFRVLLGQVRQLVLEALEHQDYPFSRLVEELQPRRSPDRSPIIEVMFNLQQTQRLGSIADRMVVHGGSAEQAVGELNLERFHLSQEDGQFDLTLLMFDAGEDIFGGLKYNPDLFDASTMTRMGTHYMRLLESLCADPATSIDALPMLTETELSQLAAWNATDAPYPSGCLHDLIVAQAARTPDAIALTCEGETLTYAELDQQSNRLAHLLRERGVGPNVLVGVLVDRSLEMMVALLGVLKAGGAYVPLDPGFPAERLAFMLEDSHAPILLTQKGLARRVPTSNAQVLFIDAARLFADQPANAPTPLAGPEDLAYVIFTSGSTGKPKGVQIPHRAVVNFMISMAQTPGLRADDVLAAVTTLSFDIAALELFLPLTVGARVAIVEREVAGDGAALAEVLEEEGATVMQATPVTWRLLLAAKWQPPAHFKALCGGEAMPPQLAARLLELDLELWNMYGPTETTIWSTVQRITDGAAPILIGRPIANTQAYILNAALQPAPIGAVGALYLGGDGLAKGYLNRPELTAERFTANPFSATPGSKIYDTGDLARYLPDGTLEVLGRSDHQVKVRGFRIELGEIESALVRFDGVREAAVTTHPDPRGDQRLVAYLVVGDGQARPGAGELRTFLKTTLPDYMLPSAFVFLDNLPLTANGKVDRRALLAPDAVQARGDERFTPPTTQTEQAIAAVWRELLGLDRVSVYDNFFDLGGHSLIAVEALTKLNQQMHVKLNPHDIRLQTLGQMAASYDALLTEAPAQATATTETMEPLKQAEPQGWLGAVRRIVVRETSKKGGGF